MMTAVAAAQMGVRNSIKSFVRGLFGGASSELAALHSAIGDVTNAATSLRESAKRIDNSARVINNLADSMAGRKPRKRKRPSKRAT